LKGYTEKITGQCSAIRPNDQTTWTTNRNRKQIRTGAQRSGKAIKEMMDMEATDDDVLKLLGEDALRILTQLINKI
jgi:hypothetical protein